MQVTHKLMAQTLAQGNASASQGDRNFGGKRTATTLEVDVSDHANAYKHRKNTPIASEKAPKQALEKAIDNTAEKAIEIASEDEGHDQTSAASNIVEDDTFSIHAGVDELLHRDALDSVYNGEL